MDKYMREGWTLQTKKMLRKTSQSFALPGSLSLALARTKH